MPFVMLSDAMPKQIDGADTIIVLTVVSLAVAFLQFFCCWKWRNIFISLIPGVVDLGLIATFFILLTRTTDPELVEGYAAYLEIFVDMFGAILGGWAAWFTYRFSGKKSGGNPFGY